MVEAVADLLEPPAVYLKPPERDLSRERFDEVYGRYRRQLTKPRVIIAEYAISKLFQPTATMFVQASSCTLALAEQLCEANIASYSILTNSAMLMWMIDEKRGPKVKQIVWPMFDPECGGWIPRGDDPGLADTLASAVGSHLSERKRVGKLDALVIYPRELSTVEGPCFPRLETARMVAYLAPLADEIYVLVEASRLADASSSSLYSVKGIVDSEPTEDWETIKRQMRLVIAGYDREDSTKTREALCSAGYKVHWHDSRHHKWIESHETVRHESQSASVESSGISAPKSAIKAAVPTVTSALQSDANSSESLTSKCSPGMDDSMQQVAETLWQEKIMRSNDPVQSYLWHIVAWAAKKSVEKELPAGCHREDLRKLSGPVIEFLMYHQAMQGNPHVSSKKDGGASTQVGKSRNTLHKKIKSLGLTSKDFSSESGLSFPELFWKSNLKSVISAVLLAQTWEDPSAAASDALPSCSAEAHDSAQAIAAMRREESIGSESVVPAAHQRTRRQTARAC